MPHHALLRLGALSLLLTGAAVASENPDADLAAQRVRAHTTFLADDLLEGRGTGTRGYALAAHYVASQFARIGLEPGADDRSYLQTMKFVEATNKFEAGQLVIRQKAGEEDTLTAVTDMLISPAIGQPSARVTARAVFIGFGVHAPDLGHDDFAGADLQGKIAVVLYGAPKQFESTQRAHHSHSDLKRSLAAKQGAVGFIVVTTPWDEARYPWAFIVGNSRFPAMRLLAADGSVVDAFPQLQAGGYVSRAAAGRLFAASGHTVEEAFARAEAGQPQTFPLNVELTLGGEASLRTVESANVLGWLPGADPALAGEPIVVTGHLDHLGIGTPVNGDSIYNGAADNALGIGLILAAAEELAAGPRLPRPILFAALTAEEKGLLGAQHLAQNPPARVKHFAANVNVDMPLFPAPVSSLIAWGEDHTTLGTLTHTAAARAGFTVTPDPMPEETIFIRSDQYPFVRTGVPAIYLSTGQRSDDKDVDLPALWMDHLKRRYHKPSDDLSQPIHWPSTGVFARLVADILGDIARDPQAPAWLPGDFFGERFGRR